GAHHQREAPAVGLAVGLARARGLDTLATFLAPRRVSAEQLVVAPGWETRDLRGKPFADPVAAPIGQRLRVRQRRRTGHRLRTRRRLRTRGEHQDAAQRKARRDFPCGAHGLAPSVLPSAVVASSSRPPPDFPLRNGATVTLSVSPAFTVPGRQPRL